VTEETPQELSPEELDDLLDDQADAAEDFLNGLLDVLDMDGEAEADIEDDTVMVEVVGPDMGVLIGRHGSTLEALQELTRAAVQHASASRVKLVLDIEGYRDRQRSILERRALSVAAKVRKEREPVELEPMSAYERKVIHSILAEVEGVMTVSEGEEPDRYIVVRPA
jgi:spoIIIJ-associated protein